MPLFNPSHLYTGGAANLNPLPYVNIAIQARARKQAKDEALDKYFSNLPNTINEQGLRDQEVPILHAQKDAIQQYYMQNRDAIKKGNTPEAFNMGKLFRDAQGTVTESLNNTKKRAELAKLRANPKNDYIFRNPEIMQAIADNDLPVNHPNYKPLDINKLTLPPAPFDPAKYNSAFKDIKYDYKTSTANNPNDKFTLIKTETPALSEGAKQTIYQRATDALTENPSFEEHIKKALSSDPNLIGQLHKTFKDNYGRDIDPTTADHDIAAAYTLLGMGNAGIKSSTIPNQDAKNKEWDRREAIRNRDIMERAKKNATDAGLNINDVYGKIQTNQDNGDINTTDNGLSNGREIKAARFNTLPNDAQQILMQSFKQSGHDVTADDIYQVKIPNGDIVFYQTDDEGKPRPSEKLKIFTLSKVGTNLKAQPDVKGKRAVVAEGEPNKAKVHTGYSRADLKGGGWSDKQIDAAVKAGKIKLD